MDRSGKNSLSKKDLKDWGKDFLKYWVSPVAILYLSSLLGILQQTDHTPVLHDLMPSQMVLGGMATTTINSVINLINKWRQGE